MRYVTRSAGTEILKAGRHFPAIILTGPRRAGKTTLLRHLHRAASYVLLEDPDIDAVFSPGIAEGFPRAGGFPEVVAEPSVTGTWFRSYVQTYLERDVRAVSLIRNLATFRRFMALLASRCGQMLNKTDLAAPLGVSVPTIAEWLSILRLQRADLRPGLHDHPFGCAHYSGQGQG